MTRLNLALMGLAVTVALYAAVIVEQSLTAAIAAEFQEMNR